MFEENYQNEKIMHIIINKFIINDKHYITYEENMIGDHLCLEINFISISKDLVLEIGKILEKFQIRINKYLDKKYITNFFDKKELNFLILRTKLRQVLIRTR